MPILSGKCLSQARMDNVTAIVTGSNTGIGKETVLNFYKRGCKVIMACRDLKKANNAKEDIIKKCANEKLLGEILIVKLDLSSLKSVRECADQLLKSEPKINLLVNNAGVMMCPKGKTEDGFEIQMGTNHMGHFLLTLLLLPRIINSKPARIVNVSSVAHKMGKINFDDMHYDKRSYKPIPAYSQSKLANVLFTLELAKKLKDHKIEGVNVYCLHPGIIATDLGRHLDNTFFRGTRKLLGFGKIFSKTPKMGAQTTIFCSIDEKCADETGLYYSDCKTAIPSNEALKPEVAKKLWDVSIKSVGLENYNPFVVQEEEFENVD